MNLQEAIAGRRSVREYTAQPVDEATIRRLIDAAVHAPNAANQQLWAFTVVRDQDLLTRVSREAKRHMLGTLDSYPNADRFRGMLSDPAFHIFYHAPALVLVYAVTSGPWIVEDCAMAAQNLMLAAYDAGLGTCWIGFAQNFLNTPEGKQLLDLPLDCVPIAPIILGHPKTAAPPVPRNAPDVRWIG